MAPIRSLSVYDLLCMCVINDVPWSYGTGVNYSAPGRSRADYPNKASVAHRDSLVTLSRFWIALISSLNTFLSIETTNVKPVHLVVSWSSSQLQCNKPIILSAPIKTMPPIVELAHFYVASKRRVYLIYGVNVFC